MSLLLHNNTLSNFNRTKCLIKLYNFVSNLPYWNVSQTSRIYFLSISENKSEKTFRKLFLFPLVSNFFLIGYFCELIKIMLHLISGKNSESGSISHSLPNFPTFSIVIILDIFWENCLKNFYSIVMVLIKLLDMKHKWIKLNENVLITLLESYNRVVLN